MKTTQPPIINDQRLLGYQCGAEQLQRMLEHHETELMAERQKPAFDAQLIDQLCYQLHHIYDYYNGIQGAIAAYQQKRQIV